MTMNELDLIKPGGDVRDLWREVNKLIAANNQLSKALTLANAAIAELRFKPEWKRTGGSGSSFKGEWSSTRKYSVDNMVKISLGLNAGTYIAFADPPIGSLPYNGMPWVMIGRVVDQSSWM